MENYKGQVVTKQQDYPSRLSATSKTSVNITTHIIFARNILSLLATQRLGTTNDLVWRLWVVLVARLGDDLHHIDDEFLVVVFDLGLALLPQELALPRVDLDNVRLVLDVHR